MVSSRRLRPATGERLGSYLRKEVADDAPEQLRLVAGRRVARLLEDHQL
jgi:hypothetical protein